MFEPLLSPLFSSLFSSLIAAAQRVFITVNGVDAHFTIENTLVFDPGDTFEFEFLAPTGATAGDEYLCDSSVDTGNRGNVLLRSGNYLVATGVNLAVDGVSITSGDPHPTDGKIHKCFLTFDSTKTIGRLGTRFNIVDFYSGILSNPKATISGVTTAWQLNRLTGNTEQAANGNNLLTYVNIPTGAPDRELFTKNTSTDPDQWENADKSRIIQIA